MSDDWIIDEPDGEARATFILSHGAGAGMDTPFMQAFAEGLTDGDVRVIRFEFPYMQKRRREGGRRPPDRQPKLLESWRETIRETRTRFPSQPLFIGGKSMGGRMASLIADESAEQQEVKGLICLGYPFHPPGRPEKLRTEHLKELSTPALILQGERDPFGKPDEVASYGLSPTIKVEYLPDGDHSFKPRKASGHTLQENLNTSVQKALAFVSETA
ncbi:MAG TPA: alpha/beta family hydrolase [Acidobacteriota bacterium]|nr:alpha/beta family hydrolase [Acidobacteriota bacterium]